MKKDRLKKLLRNAITWIDEECSNFFASEIENEYEWYEKTLDITKDELNELGISWIKETPEKIESFKPYPAMAYIHSLNGENYIIRACMKGKVTKQNGVININGRYYTPNTGR